MTSDIPKDPIILLSYINMKLRDFYPSLDALCEDMDINRKEVENKLSSLGYEYRDEYNSFRPRD